MLMPNSLLLPLRVHLIVSESLNLAEHSDISNVRIEMSRNTVCMSIISSSVLGLDCEKLVNKEYVFNYYVQHNDITGAVQFVTSRVPPLENPTPCPSHILSLSSNMPHSTQYLSNTLLDELAR